MSKSGAEKIREELIAYLESYSNNGTKEAAALTKNGTKLFGVIDDANSAAAACLDALREGDVGKIASSYTNFMRAHNNVGSEIRIHTQSRD